LLVLPDDEHFLTVGRRLNWWHGVSPVRFETHGRDAHAAGLIAQIFKSNRSRAAFATGKSKPPAIPLRYSISTAANFRPCGKVPLARAKGAAYNSGKFQ